MHSPRFPEVRELHCSSFCCIQRETETQNREIIVTQPAPPSWRQNWGRLTLKCLTPHSSLQTSSPSLIPAPGPGAGSRGSLIPLSCSPSVLSLQVGPGVRGPEQHHANQACDPDPVSGVCPVSAPPQPERGPHRPGRLLHCTRQGGPFSWRDTYTGGGLDS